MKMKIIENISNHHLRPLIKFDVRQQTRHEAVITMKMILISYTNQVDLLQWQVLTTCRTVPDRVPLYVMNGNHPRVHPREEAIIRFKLDWPRQQRRLQLPAQPEVVVVLLLCEVVNPCRCLCPNLPINFWATKFITIKVRHILLSPNEKRILD